MKLTSARINFSELHREKLFEKKLLVLVSQWLELGTEYFEIFACSRFLKNAIFKCKLRLLEPIKQPNLKIKMFSDRERLNPNNEKYLVKNIGYKI